MGKVRVLLADDHAVVRSGIRNALHELPDLEVVGEVGDGPTLLPALERLEPDLLVIDVTMPQFEPIAAMRDIRQRYPGLKILVVSAYDDDAYVQGLLGVGVDGYHLKDQPLSDLRLAAQRVLEGERWISSNLINKLLGYSESSSLATLLTDRQREILALLAQGHDNQSLARDTGLSVKTIENHLTRIYRQIGVQSRLEALRFVTEHPEILMSTAASVSAADLMPRGDLATLLVDDNVRYRNQLRRMLSRAYPQAVVYEAANTSEAMRVLAEIAPRIVLVDVILGEEDGIKCARLIKSAHPQSRVVLITAYPDREFRRLGIEAGASALLDKKDLDVASLRLMIDDALA